MNFLNNLNINLRLNLIFSTILVLVFFVIGLLLYQSEKKKILDNTQVSMANEIKELSSIIESQLEKDKKQITTALQTLNFVYKQYGKIVEMKQKIEIEAVDVTTLASEDVKINEWVLNTEQLFQNTSLLEQVNVATGAYISIMQKIDNGYIFLTTNLPENLNERRVFYLPNTSKIVYTIEKGENFYGEVQIFENTYKMSARPIYIDGKIKGMLCVAYDHRFSEEVINFFGTKNYYKTGYPFVADKSGNVIIHPRLTGDNISETKFFYEMKKAKSTKQLQHFRYRWPENRKGKWKYMHVDYNEKLEFYIATTYDEKNLLSVINRLKINIALAVLISSLSVILSVWFLINRLVERVQKINEKLRNLSQGIIPDKMKVRKNDEIGELISNLNKIVANQTNFKHFTEKLKNDEYGFEYDLRNSNDLVEKNLVSLKEKLRETEIEENKRKAEEKIEQWKTEGLSKFIGILRFQNTKTDELAYEIISNLIKYLGATQGGFFLLDTNRRDHKYLELVACYAYDKRRIAEKRIPADAGLIGRVVIEKKHLIIDEIPENYIKIASSLGESSPNNLLIVPLIFNEEVLGVIEISSFNEFEKHHIDFVESIAQNIASTISGIKNTEKTEELLSQSRRQSAEMERQKTELQQNISQLEVLRNKSEAREIEMQSIIKAIETTALILELDTDGKILSTNDKFANIVKQSRHKIIGKNHKDFTSMNINSEEYKKFWEELRAGKSKKFVESLTVEDRPIWLSQNYTPIFGRDKKVTKILNIAIDVTENKYLEKQLRAQVREISKEARTIRKEQRKINKERQEIEQIKNDFENYKQKINDNFVQLELAQDGIISKVNQKASQIFQKTKDALVGENISNLIIEEDKEKYQNILVNLKIDKKVESVISFKKYNGEIFKMKIIQSTETDARTRVRKFVIIGLDI